MDTVLDRFERVVSKYPDRIAFSDESRQITFGQLKEEALHAACGIASCSVCRKAVGVIARHSVDTIVLFLAVIYSGNFYIPLDEEAPEERNRLIVEKSRMELLLGAAEWIFDDVEAYTLEQLTQNDTVPETLCKIRKNILATDPLYAVYTSGSTGVPKGVVKSHMAMLSFVDSFMAQFDIAQEEVLGNQTPFYFDASAKDIYLGLTMGLTVHIIDKTLFSIPLKLVHFLNDKKITMICWSPSALMIISQLNIFRSAVPLYLKKIFFVGEVFGAKQLNRWKENLPEAEFVNLYGSSEIAGVCTYYAVQGIVSEETGIPLGFALPGMEVFLLKEENGKFSRVEEAGEEGEICVRGPVLGLGYLNDPQRTAEAFIQNPFRNAFREILYRTGDLARYDEEGKLWYISRKDFQIKHMGHRVELPEIELKSNRIFGVRKSACVYDGKKKRIHLFVETEENAEISTVEITEQLKESLPSYMVPGKVRILDEIPLNANGKIDRMALMNQI